MSPKQLHLLHSHLLLHSHFYIWPLKVRSRSNSTAQHTSQQPLAKLNSSMVRLLACSFLSKTILSILALQTASLRAVPAAGVAPARNIASSPIVMGSQKSRRSTRRAKRRQGGDRPPPPAAQTSPATPVEPSPIDNDPALAEQDQALQAAFVRDNFADTLPSFEDFSRRDVGKSRRAARRARSAEVSSPEVAPPASLPAPPLPGPPPASLGSFDAARTMPKRPLASPKTGAERAFELLSFDTIDERPAEEESYDLLDKILGKGVANKADAFYLPYLQTGHVFMLLVLLLACSVTYPGFPLTQVPADYRELLQQGIVVTFAVNSGCAWYSRAVAAKKQESVWFWMTKCFLLGGLALGELVNAVPDPPNVRPNGPSR